MITEEEFKKDVNSNLTEWLSGYIIGEIEPATWRCETSRSVQITQVKGHISKKLNDKYQNLFGWGVPLSGKVKDVVHDGLTEMGYIKRDRFGIYDLSQDSLLYGLEHRFFTF